MKLIKPSYEILTKFDFRYEMLKNIEIAGRTCYKSEDKITEHSAVDFVEMIIKRGHESVLEHEKITVRIICDRGVSHELVRHRIASFSQESTRYCNYSKDKFENQITFIIPLWIPENLPSEIRVKYKGDEPKFITSFLKRLPIEQTTVSWLKSIALAEKSYNDLVQGGWVPQQARSVLPNSLKTEIVITANLREWRLIFKQRTAQAAHPQMREIMQPMLDEFKIKIPVIFNDIDY